MKSSINKLNNGFVGLNYLNQYDSGRITPTKYYNDVMDAYELGDEYQNTYVPPSQWVSLPKINPGDQRFAGVFAIYDDANFAAFQVITSAGNYVVDWGDGTTGSFASSTTAQKKYEPSVYASLTSDVFRGYKTLVISVTPTTGNLTQINLSSNYQGQTNLNTGRSKGWLNIRVAGATISVMHYGASSKLEQIEFVGPNQITSMGSHFSPLYSLKKIPQYFTGRATTWALCFNGTPALTTVPAFDLSSTTSTAQMFYGANALKYVPWMDTSKVTNMNQMFYFCVGLRSVPPFNTSNVTNMSGMFIGCYALKSVPKFNTSKVTTFANTFQWCTSLKTVPNFDYSSTTTTNRMFYDSALSEFPPASFPLCTDFNETFYRNETLTKVGKLDCSAGITFSSMFLGCQSLTSVDLTSTANGKAFNNMFDQCTCIKTIRGLSMGNGLDFRSIFQQTYLDSLDGIIFPSIVSSGLTFTGFNSMFSFDYSINKFPTMDVSGLSGASFANVYSNMFNMNANNGSLMSIGITGIQHNFNIANQLFGPTALNNLYSSLAVVGASGSGTKTITITSNWGATLPSHNPAIAIAKGWTVTN